MTSLLSLLSVKEKAGLAAVCLLALVLAAGVGAWFGYSDGYETAAAKGRADLLAERLNRAEEAVERALLVATVEAEARRRVENAVEYSNKLETKLDAAERSFAVERSALSRRIDEIAARARVNCRGLSAEWVRDYNFALTGSGGESLPGNAGAALAADASGAIPGAVPRIPSGSSLTDPADILAHARDYGEQCRRYARQVRGWQETHSVWKGISQ